MNHEQAEKLLGALIFDDLDEQSKAQLLAHLETDADLRESLADLRMALKVTTDAVQHGPEPVLSENCLRRLEKLSRSRRHPRIIRIAQWAAVAACITIVTGFIFLPSLQKTLYQKRNVGPQAIHAMSTVGPTDEHFLSYRAESDRLADQEAVLSSIAGRGLEVANNTWEMKEAGKAGSRPADPGATTKYYGRQLRQQVQESEPRDGDVAFGEALVTNLDNLRGGQMGYDFYSEEKPSKYGSDGGLQTSLNEGMSLSSARRKTGLETLQTNPEPLYAKGETLAVPERSIGQEAYGNYAVMKNNGDEALKKTDSKGLDLYAYDMPTSTPITPAPKREESLKESQVLQRSLSGPFAGGGYGMGGTGGLGGGATQEGLGGGMMGGMERGMERGRARLAEEMIRPSTEPDNPLPELAGESAWQFVVQDDSSSPENELSSTRFGSLGKAEFQTQESMVEGQRSAGKPVAAERSSDRFQRELREVIARYRAESDNGVSDWANGITSKPQTGQDLALLENNPVETQLGVSVQAEPVDKLSMLGDLPQVETLFRRTKETAERLRQIQPSSKPVPRQNVLVQSKVIQMDEGALLDMGVEVFSEQDGMTVWPAQEGEAGLESVVDQLVLHDAMLPETSLVQVQETTRSQGHAATLVPGKPVQQDVQPSEFTLPPASRFKVMPVNPWVLCEQDALSTFALDVDTASYVLCRQYIHNGFLPPAGAVRMEEFVNVFDYAYTQRSEPTFSVITEGMPSPFVEPGQALSLLKVAVKARTVGRDQRKAAHLVFVVDASASMGQTDRLPLIQQGLSRLVEELGAEDRVSLVSCSDQASLLLEGVSARDRDVVAQTVHAIQPSGSTNLLAGIQLGYATARQGYVAGQINQVILCSDGVANVGATEAESVLEAVAQDRKQGIMLMCVGVGYGAYNDVLLEALANQGDGRYVFVDAPDQVDQVFVQPLASALQTVAKDARIQVKFNPNVVRRYRLIGYENRDMKDTQFRDDTVDAGEVGSGQCATALYEIELKNNHSNSEDLGTVFVRYKDTDTQAFEEITRPLTASLIRRRTVAQSPRFYLAASAARFAEWLRQSEHAKTTRLDQIQTIMDQVSAALPLDQAIRELAELIRQADGLPRAP